MEYLIVKFVGMKMSFLIEIMNVLLLISTGAEWTRTLTNRMAIVNMGNLKGLRPNFEWSKGLTLWHIGPMIWSSQDSFMIEFSLGLKLQLNWRL